jgi:hypothetical protein
MNFDDERNDEAMKPMQGTERKENIRVDITGSKEDNLIHVESLRLLYSLSFQERNPPDPWGPLD